jgi:hypothetical protein
MVTPAAQARLAHIVLGTAAAVPVSAVQVRPLGRPQGLTPLVREIFSPAQRLSWLPTTQLVGEEDVTLRQAIQLRVEAEAVVAMGTSRMAPEAPEELQKAAVMAAKVVGIRVQRRLALCRAVEVVVVEVTLARIMVPQAALAVFACGLGKEKRTCNTQSLKTTLWSMSHWQTSH